MHHPVAGALERMIDAVVTGARDAAPSAPGGAFLRGAHVGSFELEAQYYTTRNDDSGKGQLVPIKDKHYVLNVFGRPGITSINTRSSAGDTAPR